MGLLDKLFKTKATQQADLPRYYREYHFWRLPRGGSSKAPATLVKNYRSPEA
ncbi:MAG: hypothetical protein IJE94_09090 [Oscillospiraceae bacterium]|nr:hypothetical protein [Oscillospiraceae bacterium]